MKITKKAAGFIILAALTLAAGFTIRYEIRKNRVIKYTANTEINEDFDYTVGINKLSKSKYDEVTYSGEVDTSKLGSYQVVYSYNNKNYDCTIKVVDTKEPELEVQEFTIRQGLDFNAESFVLSSSDDTNLTFSFAKKLEANKPGDYTVSIKATDECGNSTTKETILHLLEEDKEAPTLTGLDDITIRLNDSINVHSKVYITDNFDEYPYYEVDTSNLDVSTPGDYTITYTTYDEYGNTASYDRKVTVTNESSGNRTIYLTFDDGPSKNTDSVLSILQQYGVHATFFVTGANPDHYDCFRKEIDAGNEVAIHTYTHDYASIYASIEAYQNDFNQIQTLLRQQLGYNVTTFRFPGGSSNKVSAKYCVGIVTELVNWANENNLTYVDWNVVSGDGNVYTSVANMISTVKGSPQYDSIVLLCHDSGAATNTVQALPTIIQYYQSLGYTFKVIDDFAPECHHTINN